MKKYEVRFRPQAEDDLFDLYAYIAREAGPRVAAGYIDRIEAACLALENFPERGRARDDLRRGVRILGFERRAAIAFTVLEAEVVIIRVFYGGRAYEHLLRGEEREG